MAQQAKKPPEPGINRPNIKAAVEKLSEALGKKWVSDNPSVCIPYFRDFTITVGKHPNIVALPHTTEEVQKVMEIAVEHQLPVVPQSTGFNHGGLTLPRKGGIMLDLKRMDKIEYDPDSMTVTIGPHARNAAVYAHLEGHMANGGKIGQMRIRPALSLSMGSSSMLSNYVARGGSAVMCRYHNNSEMICSMTWVLPDGSTVKTGPGSVPGVGSVPVMYGPGGDISGLFVSADGMFGVCTEMVVRCIPEWPLEEIFVFESKVPAESLERAAEFCYVISQADVADFIYKAHHGSMATGMQYSMPFIDPDTMADMLPENPVLVIVGGVDQEELDAKIALIDRLGDECGMNKVALSTFGEMAKAAGDKKLGPRVGGVMRHRGAFQWTACNLKIERIPHMYREFAELLNKYMKPSDPDFTLKKVLSGTAIQGPYPWGRVGTCEFDFWWDQGNPEAVKRAQVCLRKVAELFVRNGGALWRNMYGNGEIGLPATGTYYELLKEFKKVIDPDNLCHPDIHPVTDDYV